jgi:pimeloyl-ACP methyl ester carboxylesterase
MFGRQDLIVDADRVAAKVHQVLPHAQVEVLDTCGHLIHADQFGVVSKHLAEFLRPRADGSHADGSEASGG